MIWLTWRQHRKQVLFTVLGLAVLAGLMLPTGLAMRNAFADKGLDACIRASARGDAPASCDAALDSFNSQFGSLALVGLLFVVLPVLVGLFFGGPLVAREVEHGTHRLVWTQGVSRRHWAVVKIGLVSAAALAVATIYGLGMSWWIEPLRRGGNLSSRLAPLLFDMQGVVPIAYTLFAVALGIFAGTVWPRVLPAMAATLAGYAGLRIALTFARPHYISARERTSPIVGTVRERELDDWVLAQGVRDADGRMVARNSVVTCTPDGNSPGGGCGDQFGAGAYNWQLYQPGSRFWPFQAIEAGIFTVLAVLLVYLAIRRVRRLA